MGSREIKGESVISRKGKVIAMKQNKLFKKLWVFMLVLSFLATQFATVQAAAKTNKETISLNKSVYTLKKGKTVKLKAVLNKAAKRKGVKWSSSNRKVATVSKNDSKKKRQGGHHSDGKRNLGKGTMQNHCGNTSKQGDIKQKVTYPENRTEFFPKNEYFPEKGICQKSEL